MLHITFFFWVIWPPIFLLLLLFILFYLLLLFFLESLQVGLGDIIDRYNKLCFGRVFVAL